jgi:dUTP pyrophosphatase
MGDEPVKVIAGNRIAQLVIQKHEVVEWEEADSLNETERGEGGFGSTGYR